VRAAAGRGERVEIRIAAIGSRQIRVLGVARKVWVGGRVVGQVSVGPRF
jgi:hypothetical protein